MILTLANVPDHPKVLVNWANVKYMEGYPNHTRVVFGAHGPDGDEHAIFVRETIDYIEVLVERCVLKGR